MTFSKHIPLEDLTDLAEQINTSTNREAMLSHLETCANCTKTFDRLQHVVGLMKKDTSEDAPRDVLQRALNIFGAPERVSLLKKIVAALSFDSFTLEPTFGTRSGQSEARQLIFSADENDIDLHISAQENKWVIAGQVFGQGCKEGEVNIEGENVSLSSALSDSCEFTFPPVPS
ncbi:MAG TPA: hypothetical protein VLB68_00725, partial [Pyrinomonadaceae bacterium]|nr:hypothetical protein [Pyrinomonadaceae bacterium]